MAVSDVDVCCWAYEAQTRQLRSALAGNPGLVNKKDSHERTALHWACVSGQTDIVKLLISLGVEVLLFPRLNTELSYVVHIGA